MIRGTDDSRHGVSLHKVFALWLEEDASKKVEFHIGSLDKRSRFSTNLLGRMLDGIIFSTAEYKSFYSQAKGETLSEGFYRYTYPDILTAAKACIKEYHYYYRNNEKIFNTARLLEKILLSISEEDLFSVYKKRSKEEFFQNSKKEFILNIIKCLLKQSDNRLEAIKCIAVLFEKVNDGNAAGYEGENLRKAKSFSFKVFSIVFRYAIKNSSDTISMGGLEVLAASVLKHDDRRLFFDSVKRFIFNVYNKGKKVKVKPKKKYVRELIALKDGTVALNIERKDLPSREYRYSPVPRGVGRLRAESNTTVLDNSSTDFTPSTLERKSLKTSILSTAASLLSKLWPSSSVEDTLPAKPAPTSAVPGSMTKILLASSYTPRMSTRRAMLRENKKTQSGKPPFAVVYDSDGNVVHKLA